MTTQTEGAAKKLRGDQAAKERRQRRTLKRRWQNHPASDIVIAIVGAVTAFALHTAEVYEVAATRAEISTAQLGLLAVLTTLFAFTLAAVSFGWRLRPASDHLSKKSTRSELKRSWVAVLRGTAVALLLLASSWLGDVLFRTDWLVWVSLAAVLLIVVRTARALWLLTALIGLSD